MNGEILYEISKYIFFAITTIIATNFISVKNEDSQTVELTKYQIVKAELINVEE